MSPVIEILLKGVFNPEPLHNPLASCCFINLDSLLLHTAHFDESIGFSLFVFAASRFLLSAFFLCFKQLFYK